MKKFIKMAWPYFVSAVAVLALAVLLQGCRTPVPTIVERVRTDTLRLTTERRDSVWLHDSVFFSLTGDTVRIERWRTKYVERLRVDTVYRSRTDTVPKPYPVEKLVERQLTWWQRLRLGLGSAVLIGLVGFVGWKLRRFFVR